jgi:hypothetical protein
VFGIPDGIVSDRGSLFTSHFWRELSFQLAVKRRLSTAFHPQTDGQTERQNQRLEHYLRVFCAYDQADWAKRLIIAQWAYNNCWHSTIKMPPAQALFGYLPKGPADAPPAYTARVPKAEQWANTLRQQHASLEQLLQQAQASYAKFYNRKHTPMSFVEDDWVLLSAKNVRQRRPSNKLADKYLGPFQITEVIGDSKMAYRLRLPTTYRIHDVFPVSLLEPFNRRKGEAPEQLAQPEVEADMHYEVEAILAHKGPKKHREFLVRWKGYSSAEDSWEPRAYIDDGPLISRYEEALRSTK